MTLWAMVVVGVGLAMDAFAVSVVAGMALERVTAHHVFRAGFHFGLFQAVMPIVGWFLGSTVADRVATWAPWVAFALLAVIGLKMIKESRDPDTAGDGKDLTRGWSLVSLSIATSIDAMAVGVSLAMLGVSVWLPSAVIGVVTATLSSVGILFGNRLGARWSRWARLLGGLVLIGIGLHLAFG